ncbi:MAG: NADH dehydrogenase subunit L [Candidatus Methanohalarchaeum thermophilum]|uniref:NADH dehydrogenase subunit L n=1 Tax=Methanohalarchaeum thermophilum TaxID=1903181 RepID=A0A1Q6DX73_METT1|nr:MAG: NADH dehydrogenase subunit L [Candidatus Methanohalarchaeum thermophilum]
MVMEYAWLIPVPLFIVFGINILLNKRLKNRTSGYLATGAVAFSFILSTLIFISSLLTGSKFHGSVTWFQLGEHVIKAGYLIDPVSSLMLLVVSLVSFLVFIYSLEFMEDDRSKPRFFGELALFSGSMTGLVLADNFLLMFIFWELVGLCSYLLIGFWMEKSEAASGSKKAFLITRIGDILMLSGIMLMFTQIGSFGFEETFNSFGQLSGDLQTITLLLLFGGAVGKSAQLPLQVWIPDAMVGPTPVSALIHAATMVKAGVYLLARISPLLSSSPLVTSIIAYFGILTALFGAYSALTQKDIKEILAYSTISHIGFMVFAIGVMGYSASLFHLFNHSAFKALLFLAAGVVITETGKHDITKMGNFWKRGKLVPIATLIGCLSLAGIPPLGGWFSKEMILTATMQGGNYILVSLFILASFLSPIYIFRWYSLIFSTNRRKKVGDKSSGYLMVLPIVALATIAGLAGLFNSSFNEWMPWSLHHGSHAILAIGSTLVVLTGFTLAILIYHLKLIDINRIKENTLFEILHKFSFNALYIDDSYTKLGFKAFSFSILASKFDDKYVDGVINAFGAFGRKVSSKSKSFDDIGIDGVVNGVADSIKFSSSLARKIQTGLVRDYSLWILIGTITILIILKISGG